MKIGRSVFGSIVTGNTDTLAENGMLFLATIGQERILNTTALLNKKQKIENSFVKLVTCLTFLLLNSFFFVFLFVSALRLWINVNNV